MNRTLAVLALAAALGGCSVSSHATRTSPLGVARRSADLLAVLDQPGPLEVETISSADWSVARSGLVNLDSPKAKAAGLTDQEEPIQVFFHVVRHPTRGTFIVDTGMEKALRDAPDRAAPRGMVASAMHLERLKVHVPLGEWLAREPKPIAGVLLTHLHLDHIAGLPDVPRGTPLYAGPGETAPRSLMNLAIRDTVDRELEGQAPIAEWPYAPDADGRFAGVVDVFGDGSLWALWTPGHTPGHTAYLARTTHGPVLLTGDACHTAWGWENDVEPGTFSWDRPRSVQSLAALEQLVREHPAIDVRLGHQRRATTAAH